MQILSTARYSNKHPTIFRQILFPPSLLAEAFCFSIRLWQHIELFRKTRTFIGIYLRIFPLILVPLHNAWWNSRWMILSRHTLTNRQLLTITIICLIRTFFSVCTHLLQRGFRHKILHSRTGAPPPHFLLDLSDLFLYLFADDRRYCTWTMSIRSSGRSPRLGLDGTVLFWGCRPLCNCWILFVIAVNQFLLI